jgi:hypothetical protein
LFIDREIIERSIGIFLYFCKKKNFEKGKKICLPVLTTEFVSIEREDEEKVSGSFLE